jgi:hypothetical protein
MASDSSHMKSSTRLQGSVTMYAVASSVVNAFRPVAPFCR